MKDSIVRIVVAGTLASLAAPASAERWTKVYPWFWIDLDRVTRSGSVVVYTLTHSDTDYAAPSQYARPGVGRRLNCQTLVDEDLDQTPMCDEDFGCDPAYKDVLEPSDPLVRTLCG